MAFPPAFTNAWDNTAPVDTQAANLLGQNIRSLKTDIQQRHALLSGTLANQPTNMDATFGGVGYGALYFAIDTAQVFQWNGAAWVEVTGAVFPGGKASNAVPVVTSLANVDGISVTVPANALVIGSILNAHIQVYGGNTTGNNAVCGIQLFFGATFIDTFAVTGNSTKWEFDMVVLVTGAATQKVSVTANRREAGAPATFNAVSSQVFVNATEAINNTIKIKTFTNDPTLSTHNFITATWR